MITRWYESGEEIEDDWRPPRLSVSIGTRTSRSNGVDESQWDFFRQPLYICGWIGFGIWLPRLIGVRTYICTAKKAMSFDQRFGMHTKSVLKPLCMLSQSWRDDSSRRFRLITRLIRGSACIGILISDFWLITLCHLRHGTISVNKI